MSTVNEDLTVDACPSAPRTENENGEKDENKIFNETHTSTEEPKNSKTSKKRRRSAPVNLMKISNCHGFQIGPTIIISPGANDNNSGNKKNKDFLIPTQEIEKLFNNETPLSRKNLICIATHIGKGWENIARILNYSEGQIYQFQTNYIGSGIKEVFYQLLLDWIREKPEEATIGRLVSILWENDQKEVVIQLEKNL